MPANNAATGGTPFETATVVDHWIERPFRDMGDPDTKIYHHIMQQRAVDYVPLNDNDTLTDATAKPERSPFADDAEAFYIGDTGISAIDGGMVQFDRRFANVPAPRTAINSKAEPLGLYAFKFPSISGVSTVLNSTGGEQGVYDAANSRWVITMNANDTENEFEVGEIVEVLNKTSWFQIVYKRSGNTYTTQTNTLPRATIVSVVNGVYTIHASSGISGNPEIISWTDDAANSKTTFSLNKDLVRARNESLQVNSPAYRESVYIRTDNPLAINRSLNLRFAVTTPDGEITEHLSATSTPTNAEYADWAYAGEVINAEDETLRRWKGNIYVREQIKVIAR